MAIISKLIEGLTNDVTYYARVYPINPKGFAQSELDGQVASAIPVEVNLLDYIEATGTQYIDTGLTVNKPESYEYIIDALFTNDAYGGANGYLQFKGGLSGGVRKTIKIVYNGNTHIESIYVNNVLNSSTDWTNTYSDQNVKIGIFKLGDPNNAWNSGNAQIGKVYSCQIKKKGNLVRDFVPARNKSGVACLYEKISETYYLNAGSGTFIASELS